MRPLPAVADHYLEQRRFGVYAARRLQQLWGRVGAEFDEDWYPLIPAAAEAVAIAQKAAVITAAAYTPSVLAAAELDALPVGDIDTQAFAGINRWGNPLPQVLAGATTKAKNLVQHGAPLALALKQTSTWLGGTALTLVSDAGRQVVAADIAQRPQLDGYTRFLNTPSCNRCIILAGKFFRWNEGFQRHPRCDCQHFPSKSEAWALAEGFVDDPYDAFNRMSRAEQDRVYGENDAEAIRNGGDIYRVTNIRARGLAIPTGRKGWQSRRYGTPTKRTIDDIFELAGDDRRRAVDLMLDEGYITGPQVTGGNIQGRYFTGYAGTMGRGGTRRGATMAFQRALSTGVRDPYAPTGLSLDPATQTAAERRLHTAYLNHRALGEGRNPFGNYAITDRTRATVESEYRAQLRALPDQPQQVRRLAVLLGIS